MLTVAVDVGGTFTDVFVKNTADGSWTAHKVASTPPVFIEGFVKGVLEGIARIPGADTGSVARIVHGTTIATNAILTRSGARCGMLLTEGFRDILPIGLGWRPRMYDVQMEPVEPLFLAPRRRCLGVRERVDANGQVVVPLDENHLKSVAKDLVENHAIEVFVVCYLHSYANPAHELRTREILLSLYPEVPVTLSSEVLPRRREYRRLVVSGFDAYIKPPVASYLDAMDARMRSEGLSAPIHIMQSNGGVAGLATIVEKPVSTVLSGLAAGVIGAARVGAAAGHPNCISLDMGGTSADVALIRDGKPLITTNGAFEDYPLHIPMVEVRTIGAGGSSIAHVDSGGGLRVGPESAGANPGPACYGRGGELPTVTDASFLLGYLNPETFAGSLPLDVGLGRDAIERHIAKPLGKSVVEAALGMHTIVNSNMAQTMRLVSVERGHDPRNFTFLPFGGAGAVHAGPLAVALGMRKILVPRVPGVLSAMGLLHAPVQHDAVATLEVPVDEVNIGLLKQTYAGLDEYCAQRMESDGVPGAGVVREYFAEMQYLGQAHQLEVPIHQPLGEPTLSVATKRFHQLHDETYGYADPNAAVEIVGLRVVHSLHAPESPLQPGVSPSSDMPAPTCRRACFDAEAGFVETPVFPRDSLPIGFTLTGPAIIEQSDTTTVVYPGHQLEVDEKTNLLITIVGGMDDG